jgi:hypothetical protein
MSTVTVDSTLVERPTVYANIDPDAEVYNAAEIRMPNVATPAAGGAGQSVTVSIVVSESNLPADLNYTIEAMPGQECSVCYDEESKTVDGFDIILVPLASDVTLQASTMDVVISWLRG